MYIYIYIYTCIHKYTHIHTYLLACMHACMHKYTHTDMCNTHARTYIYISISIYICVCIYIYIYIHIANLSVRIERLQGPGFNMRRLGICWRIGRVSVGHTTTFRSIAPFWADKLESRDLLRAA